MAVEVNVKESAKWISQNSSDVRVNSEACKDAAAQIKTQMDRYGPDAWSSHLLHPKTQDESTVNWIFTIDTLNFCFWSDLPSSERFSINYKGQNWTGYWSLAAAVNRALDEGIPFTDPKFWASEDFTLDTIKHVFRSATEESVQLEESRFEVLREAGLVLTRLARDKKNPAVSLTQVLAMCDHSALKLIQWLADNLSSYRDVTKFKGRDVAIMKRAQILVGDLWACFAGKSWGQFNDIDQITMFADYRVPQILAGLGCISYSPRLLELLREGHEFKSGSEEEIELRGCSIEAVEQMLQYLPGKNAVLLDFYLWDTAKMQEAQAVYPCHKVRSVFY